jgi:hypothetical protein
MLVIGQDSRSSAHCIGDRETGACRVDASGLVAASVATTPSYLRLSLATVDCVVFQQVRDVVGCADVIRRDDIQHLDVYQDLEGRTFELARSVDGTSVIRSLSKRGRSVEARDRAVAVVGRTELRSTTGGLQLLLSA